MNEFTQTLDTTTATSTTTVGISAPTFGWSPADEHFFRLSDGAFGRSFLAGASALLESYDVED
jgi:hypothetical protein